jgi:predicted transcriptional regulator
VPARAVRFVIVARLGRGELENRVMDLMWGATGPMTPGQVHDELSKTRKLAYTTTMTILVRLYKKGWLW